MAEPSVCLICHGRGVVSSEFYAAVPGSCTGVWDMACRACNGKGLVWPAACPTLDPYRPPPTQARGWG